MKPLTVKIFGKQEHTGNNSRLQNFGKKRESSEVSVETRQ